MTRRQAIAILAFSGLFPSLAIAAQSGGGSGQELASKGHDLFVSGKPGEAAAVLREAAKADPANPWIFNLLGRAAYQSGDRVQAADAFRTALRIDSGDGYARMMLEIISQAPLAPAKSQPAPGKPRKPSRLEEEAKAELAAFARSGSHARGKTIVVDPGHGGTDKGVTGAAGTAEKDVCLALGTRLASALGAAGVRAVLTRDADYEVPLWARSAMSGLFTADLFISLHCTAAEGAREGMDVFAYAPQASGSLANGVAELENGVTRFERRPPPASPLPDAGEYVGSWRRRRALGAGRDLAAAFQSALGGDRPKRVQAEGDRDRSPGRVPDRVWTCPLKVLRDCSCPSFLVEVGYLSSKRDEERLKDTGELDRLAARMASALTGNQG